MDNRIIGKRVYAEACQYISLVRCHSKWVEASSLASGCFAAGKPAGRQVGMLPAYESINYLLRPVS
ncbi:uncharacterized protein LOC122571991 isoform X3 [Bombus pyrosoma]|uniref:uncharacterized protein LOC122571991 isoform X3 n=1 Tax=Bombus pyrosoma TaxID=396416 RepID=UPI00021A6372|nr:uncharacterized protein LOC122571991 isoform X3 [Bombus pyrosoma]